MPVLISRTRSDRKLWDHRLPCFFLEVVLFQPGQHREVSFSENSSMDSREIYRHQSARLDAMSRRYVLDSFCRNNNLNAADVLNARSRPPSPRPPRRPPQDDVQVDHDLRIAKKRLELDKISMERQKLRHEAENLKVHAVQNGKIIMKDGSVKSDPAESTEAPSTLASDESAKSGVSHPAPNNAVEPDDSPPPQDA